MHLGEVIKEYRDNNDLSMQAFADRCEVSKGYIAMLERNVNSKTGSPVVPSIETFIKVARAMHISLSELINMVDENQPVGIDLDTPNARRVPVYGRVAAGIPLEAVDNVLDWEEIPADWKGEYGCLIIKGDSMSPRILDGDRVVVKIQSDAESGDIVIALINGHDGVCKRLIKYENGIALQSLNPAYEPMFFSTEDLITTPVSIWGKVVELRGRL